MLLCSHGNAEFAKYLLSRWESGLMHATFPKTKSNFAFRSKVIAQWFIYAQKSDRLWIQYSSEGSTYKKKL